MKKFIIKLILVSIAYISGYYYFFQVIPLFFIGSVSTSIFWLFLEMKRDKSTDDKIKYLLETEEQRQNQLILVKEIVEEYIKEKKNDERNSKTRDKFYEVFIN